MKFSFQTKEGKEFLSVGDDKLSRALKIQKYEWRSAEILQILSILVEEHETFASGTYTDCISIEQVNLESASSGEAKGPRRVSGWNSI